MVILGLKRGLRIIEVPVNYRGRVGQSKITGTLQGRAAYGHEHDRPGGEMPFHLTGRRAGGGGRRARRDASVPADARRLLRAGRFRRRRAAERPSRRPVLSALVRRVLDGEHLGIQSGRTPAVRCGDLPGRRAVESRVAAATAPDQHRPACGQRTARDGHRHARGRIEHAVGAGGGRGVRRPADADRVGGVGHGTCRLDARVLLSHGVSPLLPVACRETPRAVCRVARGVLCGAVLASRTPSPWRPRSWHSISSSSAARSDGRGRGCGRTCLSFC